MTTRREAIDLLGSLAVGMLTTERGRSNRSAFRGGSPRGRQDNPPPLAPGAPTSPERVALINAFHGRSAGIERLFEARSFTSDWVMPYRLFVPKGKGPLPLVLYLHGSGGLGGDNERQLGLGNIFGTKVWALPENQERFPCYIVAPQTDRGWARYADPASGDSVARVVPGLGDGARLALGIVDRLRHELPIDPARIYLTGQSMGGGGVWHLMAERPRLFAAAVACCGSATLDDPARAAGTPLWNFHGDADQTVSPTISRGRLEAMRKAGGHPMATEYPGVGHNSWEWAYTEPALIPWLFSHQGAR